MFTKELLNLLNGITKNNYESRVFNIQGKCYKRRKVKIMSSNNVIFDKVKKIEKYLYLGYKVYELNGKEIK